MPIKSIEFRCEWFFVGWDCLSLGFHLGFTGPHLEVHLPFGFFRIGWYQYLRRTDEEVGILMENALNRPWNCPGEGVTK